MLKVSLCLLPWDNTLLAHSTCLCPPGRGQHPFQPVGRIVFRPCPSIHVPEVGRELADHGFKSFSGRAVVVHIFNSSTWGTEAGGSLEF